MHTKVLPLAELDDRGRQIWQELAARSAEPNPFFEPGYVLPQAHGLGELDAVALLVVEDEGEWLACLPFHRPRRWHRMPLRGVASWRGHEFYGLLGTPLLAADRQAGAADSLLRAIGGLTPALGYSVLDWLSADPGSTDQVSDLLRGAAENPVVFDDFQRASLRRRAQPDYEETALSAKHRRELRRQRRKLGEALEGEPEVVDRSSEAAAYGDFIALEAQAPKAERGTVIASDPGHVRFFTEMCTSFAERGMLQLLELQCAGQVVAAKCNLRAGNTLFMLKIAYDRRWSSLSPGILLELEMLKFFHEKTDATLMDSCASPGNKMINRLWRDRRTLTSYALPTPKLSGPTVRAGLTAMRSLRNQINGKEKRKRQ